MTKYPGSDIQNFKKIINISKKLLTGINKDAFSSPYSIIPIISQILGLNTPILGSGDSPYSIISFIIQMNNKLLFRDAFKIPFVEKRLIIDEIYDMIAPILLNEEDAYIDLLTNTKYKENLDDNRNKINNFRENLRDKFFMFSSFINDFEYKKGDFAQIAHYGHIDDLNRENDFLKFLPANSTNEWFNGPFPIVNEILIKDFLDNKSKNNKKVSGWIIFIANSTDQLLESGKLRKKKILQAARLAERLGAKIIGMAGLIASFAQGGNWLSEQIPNVGFTTGHAYTIANIMQIADDIIKKLNLNLKNLTVAIIGAGGSIGYGCAKLVAERHPKHLFLIDISSPVTVEKIKVAQKSIMEINANIELTVSTQLKDMIKADLIIIATNSPYSIIKSEYLKSGAIVIDDSFPKNISRGIVKKRNDVIFLEGGIVQLPYSVDINFARNIPDLLDAPITRAVSCKEIYGCLAEVLVLALNNYKKNYGLGYADTELAKDIMSKSKQFNFSSAPLQCFDQAIEDKRFQKFNQILSR